MANPTVGEVLDVLRPSFQGIDLRAVVVALGDQQGWQNAFTVIRFSVKTPEEISVEHDRLKTLYDIPAEILNKRLGREYNIEPYRGMRIELSSLAVGRLEQFVGGIHEGIIRTNDIAFRVFDHELGINLPKEMYLRGVDDEENGHRWGAYHWGWGSQTANFAGAPDGQGNKLRLDSRDLDNQARSIGFADFQDLVEHITGQSFLRGSGFALQIVAPVYARITSIIPSHDAVGVTGCFHPALGKLTLECSLRESKQGEHACGRSLGRIPVSPQTTDQKFTQFSEKFLLTESPESGHVQASLFKQAATRVELHREQSPLKSGVMAFRAFTSFVPEEDITDYLRGLTSGTGIDCKILNKFTSKENSKVFEYVVTYLLGLCHLNPILLSNLKYDVVNGGFEAGSADIIALAQDGSVILVSCTIGMPDRNKRNMLIAARTAIAQRIKVSPQAIKLILISGKPSVSASDAEMVELAAADLKKIWEMIRGGNLSEARSLLGLELGSSIF